MSNRSRRAISCQLLAVFLTVSAIGHGLHFLPGANHHGIDAASGSTCSHCCHHAVESETGEPSQENEPQDDCSICRLLAQSVDIEGTDEPVASAFFVYFVRTEASQRLDEFVGECHSRGPPVLEGLSA